MTRCLPFYPLLLSPLMSTVEISAPSTSYRASDIFPWPSRVAISRKFTNELCASDTSPGCSAETFERKPRERGAATLTAYGWEKRGEGRAPTPAAAASMSCIAVDGGLADVCANCGKHGSDIVKLKNCTACRLVKYCGVDCQRAHRKQHKKACKQRAAELEDEQLYSQGLQRAEGDFCQICTLAIPLPMHEHSGFNICCTTRVCNGCNMAAQKRGMHDCPFCRTTFPKSDADALAMIQTRVAKKDPEAINTLGHKYCFGLLGLKKDMRRTVDLRTEAAELGLIEALFDLGYLYYHGNGVQQDMAKAVEFYKKAAMQGHVMSRHYLGSIEGQKGNYDRAAKHYLISAKVGDKNSVEMIKRMFMEAVRRGAERIPRRCGGNEES